MSTRKSDIKSKTVKKAPAKSAPAAPKATAAPKPAAAPKPPAAPKPAAASKPPVAAAKGATPKSGAPKTGAPKPAAPRAAASKPAAPKAAARPGPKPPAAPRPPLAAVPSRDLAVHEGEGERAGGRRTNHRAPALTPKDFKRFEQLLLGERQRLLRELGHLEKNVLNRSLRETSGELSGYSFHMADVGTDAMEREKAFHFASAEGRALLDVDDALRRLYGGEYGICESCGNPVGRERLEVVPHARLCVSCKEKEERAQIGRSR